MLRSTSAYTCVGMCLVILAVGAVAFGEDWPQFRGPNRDGISHETGLLKQWPEGGPKLLWEMAGLGVGFSDVAIVGGKLYTMGDRDVVGEKAQYILAFDLNTRAELWHAKVGAQHTADNGGPRGAPTVDGAFVYVIGTDGDVVCAAIDTGKIVWTKNLLKDLGGANNITWKFSESPLIDGDKLLCTPGGHKAVMAALNKKTGDILWQTAIASDLGPNGKKEAGYSSIVMSQGAGVKQYVQLTNEGVIGVAADGGKFLWGYNRVANRVANISMPVVEGDFVFCSTGYGTGSALLKLSADNGGVKADEVYWADAKSFQNTHGGFVKVGDYIYGGINHNKGEPTCLEFKTGKVMWHEAKQPGKGSGCVLYADGNLYFMYEDGLVALIEATPDKYNLKSTFTLPGRPTATGNAWTHPVISDGKLYLRRGDVLFCYDVKAR
jgi:outer membrane protein assembly factor BamB